MNDWLDWHCICQCQPCANITGPGTFLILSLACVGSVAAGRRLMMDSCCSTMCQHSDEVTAHNHKHPAVRESGDPRLCLNDCPSSGHLLNVASARIICGELCYDINFFLHNFPLYPLFPKIHFSPTKNYFFPRPLPLFPHRSNYCSVIKSLTYPGRLGGAYPNRSCAFHEAP